MTPLHRPETAFVLSGGASLGAVQAGMLRALYERGIRPDVIVGTSAGALNGAFIASRPQTVATAEELGDVWRGLRRGSVFPLDPFSGLLGFLGGRDHLVPARGLARLIRRHTDHDLIEQLPIPLHVVAVDVGHAGELIERSLEGARAFLDGGGAEQPPIRMRTHEHPAAPAVSRRSGRGSRAPRYRRTRPAAAPPAG
jgi:predicted acylesterase/phospholipase RssA